MKRGDIYYADLGEGIGSEQQGEKPVIILQNNYGNKNSPTVIIAPITSKHKKELPTHVELLKKDFPFLKYDSTVLLEQVRAISKQRLEEYKGSIDDDTMIFIMAAIQTSFGMFA